MYWQKYILDFKGRLDLGVSDSPACSSLKAYPTHRNALDAR